MATITELLKKIDGVTIKEAGTGTVYVYYGDKRVRIADHEPNFNAPNRGVDKCFYTKDACNTKADIYTVVEEVAEYLGIEIKGVLKGMITKHFNEVAVESVELAKIVAENKAYRQSVTARHNEELSKLTALVSENKVAIEQMIADAEAYGNLGSNGAKRRNRTKSFFASAFKSAFGFEANLSDIREVLR